MNIPSSLTFSIPLRHPSFDIRPHLNFLVCLLSALILAPRRPQMRHWTLALLTMLPLLSYRSLLEVQPSSESRLEFIVSDLTFDMLM